MAYSKLEYLKYILQARRLPMLLDTCNNAKINVCMFQTLCLFPLFYHNKTTNLEKHGGESLDLNDRVHGISCWYSDKTNKQTYHTFLNTQWIFIKQSAHTSKLFEANIHLKVTPQ